MKYANLLDKWRFKAFLTLLISAVFTGSINAQSQSATLREQKLLNGLKLLTFDAPTSEKVTLKVRIHAGSAFDPQGKEGLMKLLAANIFPNPEAKEFFSEQLGGSLNIESNYDYIQVNATAKPESLLTMLETVATAIVNMGIDKETTAKLKAQQLQRVAEMSKDPAYLADQASAARLLGTFPYGRPEDGTAASIEKIDFADLLAAKQRLLTADNTTIALSGRLDSTLAFRAVRRYFGSWLKADKLVPSTFRQPDDPATEVLALQSPIPEKSETRLITRGTTRSGADATAYRIASRVIESRLKSLGAQRTVTVRYSDHVLPGTILISFSSAPAQKPETADSVLKILATPVTDAEFQTAKQLAMAEIEQSDILDRWLDIDTFKSDLPAKEKAKAAATSLADVQSVMSKLQKQPFASVVVSSSKSAN